MFDIQDFLNDCLSRGMTSHTVATYRSNVSTFLNFVGNPITVDIPILRDFLNYLRFNHQYSVGHISKKGVCVRTLGAYFSAISTFYDYLLFTGIIDKNIIPIFIKRYLRIKEQHNGSNRRQLLSLCQMQELVNLKMPIQDKAILLVFAKCGIRRGELLTLDIQDINFETNEIILKPKHKRTGLLVIFDDETSYVLRLFLKWRLSRAKCDSLFISPRGFRLHKDYPNKIIANYGLRLGFHNPNGDLNHKLSPHAFRHWNTTFLRRGGMPREFIQELRGDKRRQTIDIYDHIDLIELKKSYLQCVPKLLNQKCYL